jgi:phenylalanyl-tRNA synthetase alpha chain
MEEEGEVRAKAPLHPIERAILEFLSQKEGEEGTQAWFDIEVVSSGSRLSLDQVRRGIEWLKSKKMIEAQEQDFVEYALGNEGKAALSEGLPERKLVNVLQDSRGSLELEVLSRNLGAEFSVGLGLARKNNWIKLEGNKVILDISRSSEKEKEEILIERIGSKGKLSSSELSSDEKSVLSTLIKRHEGFIEELTQKKVKIRITPLGIEASKTIQTQKDEIDEITPDLILSGSWRNRTLRPIDVTSSAPNLYGGRKHPIRMFIDEVKEVFVSLGFSEIEGPIVQSAFWNFDALFIPQQHSTREMQDTFYLSDVSASLSKFARQIDLIKGSHERGEGTGSLGWRYKWSEDEASRVVLRTHTTAVTIRYLSDHKPTEARVFSVGKVFRNEKPNYKHNPEFYQIEGVTVGPRLNVRNLIYIISKFYSKLGFEKVKFWPTYFPYTEPSLQSMAYYEKKGKWMELGGMGVFRPEVTIPLGVKNPVLAWGLGLDRLVMMRYDLNDIRDLFGTNLGWLRTAKVN